MTLPLNLAINTVAVIGAGTMGIGIARCRERGFTCLVV